MTAFSDTDDTGRERKSFCYHFSVYGSLKAFARVSTIVVTHAAILAEWYSVLSNISLERPEIKMYSIVLLLFYILAPDTCIYSQCLVLFFHIGKTCLVDFNISNFESLDLFSACTRRCDLTHRTVPLMIYTTVKYNKVFEVFL